MTQRRPIQNLATMLITTNVRNREHVFLEPSYARETIDTLYRTQELHPFFLYGFVIMPNHCHFLMKVPEYGSISTIMRVFKYGVTFNIGISNLWQPRYHMVIPNDRQKALEYIHMNPVRKELIATPQEYLWSSASGKWDVSDLDW